MVPSAKSRGWKIEVQRAFDPALAQLERWSRPERPAHLRPLLTPQAQILSRVSAPS